MYQGTSSRWGTPQLTPYLTALPYTPFRPRLFLCSVPSPLCLGSSPPLTPPVLHPFLRSQPRPDHFGRSPSPLLLSGSSSPAPGTRSLRPGPSSLWALSARRSPNCCAVSLSLYPSLSHLSCLGPHLLPHRFCPQPRSRSCLPRLPSRLSPLSRSSVLAASRHYRATRLLPGRSSASSCLFFLPDVLVHLLPLPGMILPGLLAFVFLSLRLPTRSSAGGSALELHCLFLARPRCSSPWHRPDIIPSPLPPDVPVRMALLLACTSIPGCSSRWPWVHSPGRSSPGAAHLPALTVPVLGFCRPNLSVRAGCPPPPAPDRLALLPVCYFLFCAACLPPSVAPRMIQSRLPWRFVAWSRSAPDVPVRGTRPSFFLLLVLSIVSFCAASSSPSLLPITVHASRLLSNRTVPSVPCSCSCSP